MTDSNTNAGITKDSTLIPKLTTLTNQRVVSSTLTISDLIPMIDYNTSMGLSRDSTLILDPPVYNGDVTITNNGTYLPEDFNSNGEYDPTHSANYDYINSITVNVNPAPVIIDRIDSDGGRIASNTINSNWNFYAYGTINVTTNSEVLIIQKTINYYIIKYYYNITITNLSVSNSWVYIYNGGDFINNVYLYSNNNIIMRLEDNNGDDKYSLVEIRNTILNFGGISWMTFN